MSCINLNSSLFAMAALRNAATVLAFSGPARSASDIPKSTGLFPTSGPSSLAPLLKSTTPGDYHTWRYSHWLPVGDQVHVYFEAARPNNSNEIRLAVFPASFAL